MGKWCRKGVAELLDVSGGLILHGKIQLMEGARKGGGRGLESPVFGRFFVFFTFVQIMVLVLLSRVPVVSPPLCT